MLVHTHLFTPGPTNMPEAVRQAVNVPLEDHRAPTYPTLLKPLLEDLKTVFRTETGRVFVFTGSGTSGWEAAMMNCLNPGDTVLTSTYGQFSVLWLEMGKRLGLNMEVIEGEWGEGADASAYAERLAADTENKIKAVLVCHNETATGVVSDIPAIRKVLDDADHPALLFVDGVSSIGCLEFRMDDWGVDAAVCGSQKGFMMPTGLCILGMSAKAIKASETATNPRGYLDFGQMIASNDTGFYPYTPATTLIYGLKKAVEMLLEEGLDNVHARHKHLGDGVRAAVKAWGLELCAKTPDVYSDTVSAIVVPDGINSADVLDIAFNKYNLSLGAGLTKVAGKVFRIGHMGAVDELMLLGAIATTEMVLLDLGVELTAGSGVAAASEVYRNR